MSDSVIKIGFVCTGNICRSPMADVIFESLVNDAGLAREIAVYSRGTSGFHHGKPADPRTLVTLDANGYDGSRHVARQVTRDDLAESQMVIALDRGHRRDLQELATDNDRSKIQLLADFDPALEHNPDVFDPYYSEQDAFDDVFVTIERACRRLFDHVTSLPDGRASREETR